MITKRNVAMFLGIYALLRVFSFWFGPETPLQAQTIINTVLTLGILITVTYFLIKHDPRGWYIIALEMILGGGGNYLAAFGLTLRTWFLLVSIPVFAINLYRVGAWRTFWGAEKKMAYVIGALLAVVALGAWNGYANEHATGLIISDVLPYLFILYYFPLTKLSKDECFTTTVLNAVVAAVIGNVLLILGTFVGYSSWVFALQDAYYHWFRDVAGGKITELGHFYRLVLNEHLLLIPLTVWFAAKVIKREQQNLFCGLAFLTMLILAINLTRAYMLALAVSYLFLFSKTNWKRWLAVGTGLAISFILFFTAIHFAASRGTSLGWELFGIRLQSIVAPSVEDSSLSRVLLLPKIIEKIKAAPLLGQGLGDTVTVFSPVFKKDITTPHFDWGYLEILAEFGFLGTLIWLMLLGTIYIRTRSTVPPRWQMASLIALMVINLTSPALFHVLGILWLSFLLQYKSNP